MAVAAVIAVGSGIWAALSGLPPVIVTIIFFAALAVALAVPHYALVWWGRLRTRRPPPELKEEVVAIQRELIRLHNRREISGGSLWPTERPYRDLPAKEWGTHADKLRLRREDREAVAQAYELARRFNDQMLLGETTIASSPDVEPDLDGLREAFNRAAAALGLPPAPATAEPGRSDHHEFSSRNDGGELAQRCHMLAGSVERWVEKFNRGHSERAERMVAEWLEADTTDPAEARRKAYTRDEKNWEADYRLRYEIEAKKLFDEAYEMGQIAKEHEQLAIAPLAIQFDAVPRLFNEIADRLYGEAA